MTHYIVFHATRLDVKALKMDRGYPRKTDLIFGGVPTDAHDVFQHKGENLIHYLNSYKNSKYLMYMTIFYSLHVNLNFSTLGHIYFCRDRFYWRMNAKRQVDRVGYIKYDILLCSDASGLQA